MQKTTHSPVEWFFLSVVYFKFINIQNSLLNELFDLSNIDLEKCDMFARQRENILQTIKK